MLASNILLVGCTNDEEIVTNQQSITQTELSSSKYTMTITATKVNSEENTMRGLYLDGTALKSKWLAGEKVIVSQTSGSGYIILGELTAIASETNTTTLSGTLDQVPDPEEFFVFHYQSRNCDYTGQDGTLTTIGEHYQFYKQCVVSYSDITVNSVSKEIECSSIEFDSPRQSIIKFSLYESDGTTPINPTTLTIQSTKSGLLKSFTFPNTLQYGDLVINSDGSTNELFVALEDSELDNFKLTAYDGVNTYIYDKSDKQFDAGKYYSIKVNMHKLQTGDYVYSDGSIGTTPATNVIALVFSTDPTPTDRSAGFVRGYAMSVQDANGGTNYTLDNQNNTYGIIEVNGWKYHRDGRTVTNQYALLAGDARGQAAKVAKKYSSTVAVPIGYSDWFLPAIGQWYDICVNLANRAPAADNGLYYYQYNGQSGAAASELNSKLSASGASVTSTFTNSPTICYAAASRENESTVIQCTFSNSNILHLEHNGNNSGRVRPCIAF